MAQDTDDNSELLPNRYRIQGSETKYRQSPLYFDRQRLFTRQQEVVSAWKPASEIWAIRYGGDIHGVTAFGSSALFTYYFRKAMKLRTLAQYSTYLPTAVICGTTAVIMHSVGIMPSILLREENCAACLQVRAMSFQALPGVFQPLLLSFVLTALKARQFATVNMPAIIPFRPWYDFMKINMKNMNSLVTLALLINVAVAVGVTMMEQKHTLKVWDKMVVYHAKGV